MDGLLWRSGILLAILLFVVGAWYLNHRRHRRTWSPRIPRMDPADLPHIPNPLLIVVFTSRFCVACGEVLRIARTTAPEVPVVEISLGDNPMAAGRYGLVETPTLLLVDERHRIRYTAIGIVDEEELWLYVREAWDSSTVVRRLTAQRENPR